MQASILSAEELNDQRIIRLSEPYFFSSFGFVRLWDHVGGRPAPVIVEDHGRLVAYLPGVEFGIPGLRRWQSMPDGCYGRLLCDASDPGMRLRIASAITDFLIRSRYAKVYLTDYAGSFRLPSGFSERALSTTLVDVSVPDWMPPDKKMRQQIRKAQREGHRVIRFEPESHMSIFWKMVGQSSRRQGRSPKYPLRFFEDLSELATQDDRLRWLWMEVGGQPVGSSIFVVEGDQLLHWHIFYDESMSQYQASKFLPFVAAREFARQGGRYLNLGASPPNLPGVKEYKDKWGGERYRYSCLTHRSWIGRLL